MKKINKFLCVVLLSMYLFVPACFGEEIFSLQKCIETSLDLQTSLKIAKSNLNISEYAFIKSLSAFYPQLNVSSSYNYGGNNSSSGSGSYSAGVSLSQKIYDFGKTGGAVRSAVEEKKSSDYALELATQEVVFNVTEQYFEYLKAKHIVEADSETTRQSEAYLKQIEAFYAAGTKPRIDVAKSRLDYSNNRLTLLEDINSQKLAKLKLAEAIGLKNSDFEVEDYYDTSSFNESLEECLKLAFLQRPDVKQKALAVLISELGLATARSGYLPSISASGSYNYSGTEFPLDNSSWDAGLNLSIPIFSGFSTTSEVKTAEENYNIALKNKEQFELSVEVEVRQAYLALKEKWESIDVSSQSLKYAEENYELAQGRYLSGVATIVELSDARASLMAAKTSYIKSIYDYDINIATLKKTIGY